MMNAMMLIIHPNCTAAGHTFIGGTWPRVSKLEDRHDEAA
jgi:hypothetical protein